MKRRSLRFRITLTLFLFVSLSSSLFALATYIVNELQESQVLDDTLQEEFEEYKYLYQQNPTHRPPSSSTLHNFLIEPAKTQDLPLELRALGPGMHHEISMNGRQFHVLNRELGEHRLYLMYDITRIERREDILSSVLIVGVLVVSLLVLWAGYLLSGRLIAPVTDLADRVSHLDPSERRINLADEFSDSELGVIASAFDHFLGRLDQFIMREHTFTEDASHELRTPLAVINSAAELALADPQLPDSTRQPLLRIQRASRQMTRQTSALLFLARETGNPAEEAGHCQADAVTVEVVDSYRQLHTASQVEIQLATEPMTLPVPGELFEIVLANLLQNAMAHTQRGHVRVALLPQGLMVEDTGCGIQPEDLPRIFERHYRGAGSRGTGRGLDLVKRVSDRFGWKLSVSSSPGQGSRFMVHFKPDATTMA